MFLVPLIWMQSQPLSKTVIAVASLLFVLAIVLLVFFLRKLKASSKTDEDWSLTRSSLFVEPPAEASVADATYENETPAPSEPDEATPGATRLLVSDALDAEPRAGDSVRGFTPEPLPASEIATPPATSETPPAPAPPVTTPPAPPARDERGTQLFSSSSPPREARATEILSSLPPEPIIAPEEIVADTPATDEAMPFDEDVWAGLEEAQPPATNAMTHELRSPAAPPLEPPSETAPLSAARVEQRPPRAPFESPAVEPL